VQRCACRCRETEMESGGTRGGFLPRESRAGHVRDRQCGRLHDTTRRPRPPDSGQGGGRAAANVPRLEVMLVRVSLSSSSVPTDAHYLVIGELVVLPVVYHSQEAGQRSQ